MRNRTYTVEWERLDYPEDDRLRCSGLTGRVAFARLIGAIRNSGPVVIHAITPEDSLNQMAVVDGAQLGWHTISGGHLLDVMRRCYAGEDADLVYAELWANAEHERIEGQS